MAHIKSKGAFGSGGASFTAALPTDLPPVLGDAILVVMESSDSTTAAGTPATPSGYTKLFEETQGGGSTGVTTLTIFGKIAGSSEANVSITGVGDHCSGRMYVIEEHGLSVIGDIVVGTGNGANTGNGTALGITVTAASLVLACFVSTRDANSGAQFSGWTNANLTVILEEEDNVTLLGAGGGVGVASGQCAGTTTGDTTVTIATSEQWRGVHLGIAGSGEINARLTQEPAETVLRPTSGFARATQEPAEAVLKPTSGMARMTQEPAETVMRPTSGMARMTQEPIEVVLSVGVDTARVFGTIIG